MPIEIIFYFPNLLLELFGVVNFLQKGSAYFLFLVANPVKQWPNSLTGFLPFLCNLVNYMQSSTKKCVFVPSRNSITNFFKIVSVMVRAGGSSRQCHSVLMGAVFRTNCNMQSG